MIGGGIGITRGDGASLARRSRVTLDADVDLSHPDTYWITGNVIGVDGGEDITG